MFVRLLVWSLLVIPLLVQSTAAEMVVITKPLPDGRGDSWPREYLGANPGIFVMPEGLAIDNGITKTPVTPWVTKKSSMGGRERERSVESAWVNIIDLNGERYYSGELERWFPLDSVDAISIREGYEACTLQLRVCEKPYTPVDSCRELPVVLHDSLTMDDIDYVVYTSFRNRKQEDTEIYRKAGNYYRRILGYRALEVPLKWLTDLSTVQDSSVIPVECDCITNPRSPSIHKISYSSQKREN